MESSKKPISNNISILCKYCFHVLESSLNSKEPSVEFPKEFKGVNCPLFVTWKKGKDEDLRGCIGTFESSSLEQNLPKYALISALEDTRFRPISKKNYQTFM